MKKLISDQFRQSMNWFHTWVGLGLGAVLFAVFWTGSLTVFDKEIDQWMMPELRLAQPATSTLDDVILPRADTIGLAPGSEVWFSPPQDRIPAYRIYYEDAQGIEHEELLDPQTGQRLDLTDSDAGSGFFFHFHYMLHMPGVIGNWIVGLAALGMMLLVISGVFIHRKIFQDFFTFRPDKKARRVSLDIHNLTALIALPFHFLLPLSGLFIIATTYFPWAMTLPYDGNLRQLDAGLSGYQELARPMANQPGAPVTELQIYLDQAREIWREEEGRTSSGAEWIGIFNYGDANSYIMAERYFQSSRVAIGPDQITFDPKSGEVLGRYSPKPIHKATNWLEGLHWIQFDHWPMRWLYFFAGLSGCVMIGSGLIFWMQARIRAKQAEPGTVRVVRAMSIASITGVIMGSGAFLISNRLIPKEISMDVHRHELEIWTFFAVWMACLLHSLIRDKRAWFEQSIAIATAGVLAVLLNWITTGDHLIAAISSGIPVIALMDLVLIGLSSLFAIAAYRMRPAVTLASRSHLTSDATRFPAE